MNNAFGPQGSALVSVRKSAVPAAPAPSGLIHSYNANGMAYYSATYPMMNVAKTGAWAGLAGGATTTADGWATGIPTGTTSTFNTILAMDAVNGYYPPGNYEVACSNTNLTITITASAGLSSITSGAGGCTFTASTLPGAWNTLAVQLSITNSSGSPQNFTDLRINLVSDHAAILADPVAFRQSYKDAHAGAKVFRIHDWLQTDTTPVAYRRKFTDLGAQNESQASYNGNSWYGTSPNMPVSIGTKFAKAIGARPWINIPAGEGQFRFRFTASTGVFNTCFINFVPVDQDVAHGMAEGEGFRWFSGTATRAIAPLVNGTTYFFKNVTSTGFQVSLTAFGSAVTFLNQTVITTTGNLTSGSAIITGIPSTTGMGIGHLVFHANLTYGTMILSVDSSTQVTVDHNASASLTATSITFGGDLTSFGTIGSLATMTPDPYTDMYVPMLTAMKTADPTCKPLVEVGGENWNGGFPVFQWLHYVGGFLAGNDGNQVSGHAWLNLQLWKACDAVFGSGNFTLVIGGQGGAFNALGAAFDYVDPGVRNAGVTLKQQIINEMALGHALPAAVYAVGNYMNQDGAILQKAYTDNGNSTSIPDAYWDGVLLTTTGNMTAGSPIVTGIPSTTGLFASNGGAFCANLSGSTAANINSVDSGTQVTLSRNATATITGAPIILAGRFASWIQTCYNQINGLYGSAGQGDLQVQTKVPNMPIVFYECGQQISNAPTQSANSIAVGQNLITYLNGTPGATQYTNWYNTVFAPLGSTLYAAAHYTGCGEQANTANGGFFVWPITPPTGVDTPRSTFWKSI